MKKITKSPLNVPKLRFKGFEGEWEEKKIREISPWIKSGGTPKADNKEFYCGNIPFLSISNMKGKYLKTTEKFVNEKAIKFSSSYILEKNNLLLSIYATIGVPMINLIDVAIPQSILGFMLNKEYDLDFMYYLFLNSKKTFIAISETGSQPNISLKNIEKLSFIIPKLKEQQKIAKFLSLLDKQIELWNTKLQLSELFKSYYLNNLYLSQQNFYFKPKLRFKSFEGEWEEKNIREISSWIKSGGTPKADNKEFYCGNIPFLSISNMKGKYLKTTEKFVNEKALKFSSSYILEKNNLLLSIYATIGVPMINLIDVAIPQSILGFMLNKEYDLDFMYYLFLNSKKTFIAISETGSQPNISLKNIEKLSFIIPKLKEQQKIAKFFSLLDKLDEKNEYMMNFYKKRKFFFINNLFK